MQDFIFIIPEGWIQIPSEYVLQLGQAAVQNYVASGLNYLEQELININALPQGSTIIEAKLFNDEVLVIRLG